MAYRNLRSSTRFFIGMLAMTIASLALRYLKPGMLFSENVTDFAVGAFYGIGIGLTGLAIVLQKRDEKKSCTAA
jgi:hypothetical protein